MKIVTKKIVVNTVLILHIIFISHIQSAKAQVEKKSGIESKLSIPAVVFDLSDSVGPVHHSNDYIFNFFLSEARKTQSLITYHDKKEARAICNIDSLQFIVKNLIDTFITTIKWWNLGFNDEPVSNAFYNIHDSLVSELTKPRKKRNALLLTKLKNSIDALPASKEKVDLLLQYASLNITNNNSYFDQLIKFYLEAQTVIQQLTDKYEMAKAITFMGDFAKNFQDNYYAIKFYSGARALYRLAPIPAETMKTEDGKLCRKINELFYASSVYLNERRNCGKIAEYLDMAMSQFSSNENSDLYIEAWAEKFSNDSYMLSHFLYADTTENTKSILHENLNSLYFWYYYTNQRCYSYKVNYLGFSAIGKILLWEANYNESLIFYLRALPFALQGNNPGYVDGCLANIVYIYNKLNEKNKAVFYENLRHRFNRYYWGDWATCQYLLTKAEDFYYTNKYDSALKYLNRFIFDTSYKENLLPPSYYVFYKKAVGLKYPILYSRNKNDSASIYENYFHNYNDWAVRNVDELFQEESESYQMITEIDTYNRDSINNLARDSLKFETSKLKKNNQALIEEIAEKTKAITILNNKASELNTTNLALSNKISFAGKNIKILNGQNNRLKKNNQTLADSIMRSNAILTFTIKKNNELNSTNDSIATINDNLIQKNLDFKEETKSWALAAMGILIIGAIFLIILGIRIRNRVKKINALKQESHGLISQMEANSIAAENELKYSYEKNLKELTIKHEIVGLISELYAGYSNRFLTPGVQTNDTDSKLEEFGNRFKNLEAFSRHYYKLLKDDGFNKIDDEVELCRRYVEVAKINKGEIIFKDLRAVRRTDIVLPHHCLNSFTKNSIEKGKLNDEPLTISVEDRQDVENYTLLISDNGKGLPKGFNLKTLPDESTGFRNIFSQIKYFNSRNEIPYIIEFNEDSIANRIIGNTISGVIITLTFKPKK